jgi:glycosyltransferase involved in cell wall biosynthesis
MTNLLTAIVITKNEEKNILSCLRSLNPVADEIVVVDSFSTDATEELCRQSGVRFYQEVWKGYAATKNYGNSLASHNRILSMDADEVLSPELQQSILAAKNSEDFFLYSFNRLTNYCGQWIKHGGWFPDVKIRLFDRRHSKWVGDYVHEELFTEGDKKAVQLKGLCLHYSFYSIEQHINQINYYSSLAAEERFKKGKKAGIMKMIISPVFRFLKMYFFQLGFIDGRFGFVIAVNSAYARFLRYAKLIRLWKEKECGKVGKPA